MSHRARSYVPSTYLVPRYPAAVRTVRQRPPLTRWFCVAALVLAFAAGVLVAGDRPAHASAQDTLACKAQIETPEQ